MRTRDKTALQRCLDIFVKQPGRAEQIEGQTWRDKASSACYGVQMRALNLKPWETRQCSAILAGMNPKTV
jgi:hypothetical protein